MPRDNIPFVAYGTTMGDIFEFDKRDDAVAFAKWSEGTAPESARVFRGPNNKWLVRVKDEPRFFQYHFSSEEEALECFQEHIDVHLCDSKRSHISKLADDLWIVKVLWSPDLCDDNTNKDNVEPTVEVAKTSSDEVQSDGTLPSAPDITKGTEVRTFSFGSYGAVLFKNCPIQFAERVPPFLHYEYRYVLLVFRRLTTQLELVVAHEKSFLGTVCLGGFTPKDSHLNFGLIDPDIGERDFLLSALAATNDYLNLDEVTYREGIAAALSSPKARSAGGLNSSLMTMKRKICAALVFNVYALVFVGIFWAATPFLFDFQEIAGLVKQGVRFEFGNWGFGHHYTWRLFVAAISTAMGGFICGALAREKSGRVALIANIPSVVGWIAYAILFLVVAGSDNVKSDDKADGLRVGYGIMSLIAIPITCWLAMKFGKVGEGFQRRLSQQDKTLGVADWHWAWMWFPLSAYGHYIVIAIALAISIQFLSGPHGSLLASIVSLLSNAVAVAWITPLVVSFQVLAGRRFKDRTPAQRGAVVAVILVGGFVIGILALYAFAWIFAKYRF